MCGIATLGLAKILNLGGATTYKKRRRRYFMKREFLEELLGVIEDETGRKDIIDKIMDENGKSINASKSEIAKLTEQLGIRDKEKAESDSLIEKLQNSNLDSESIQKELAEYKDRAERLEQENTELRIDSALKFALQEAKVTNVDYIAFKINQDLKANEKKLELDENGHIKGISEMIDAQKKAEPTFFETEAKKEVDVKDLGKAKEDNGQAEPESLLDALTQHYSPKTDI